MTIVFWFTVVACVASAAAVYGNFKWPSPIAWVTLIAMGVFATLGQLLLTMAYRTGEASRLAVLGSLGAIFGAGFDLVIWKYVPDGWTIVGGMVAIVACTGIQILRHSRTEPKYLSG